MAFRYMHAIIGNRNVEASLTLRPLERQALQFEKAQTTTMPRRGSREALAGRIISSTLLQEMSDASDRILESRIFQFAIRELLPEDVSKIYAFLMGIWAGNEALLNIHCSEIISYVLCARYLEPRQTPPSMNWIMQVLPHCSDTNFRRVTRMDRRMFGAVVEVLQTKCSCVFENRSPCKQEPVSVQLLIFMQFLGSSGSASSSENCREKFGYSVGMAENACRRIASAFYLLSSDYIRWPSKEIRSIMCNETEEKFGFKWAFFFSVDGTTHELGFTPSFEKEAFFDRKKRYSIHALVTSDFHRRIIHLIVGWPGSVHDSRVLKSADYMKEDADKDEMYFSKNQHGLGDSAFGIHIRVVPNYKKPHSNLPENHVYNSHHSKLRIISEHTIEIVKERFQGLRDVSIKLQRKRDMERAAQFIVSGYVLHNILMDFQDERKESDCGCTLSGSDDGRDTEDEDADAEENENGSAFRETVKKQVLEFLRYA